MRIRVENSNVEKMLKITNFTHENKQKKKRLFTKTRNSYAEEISKHSKRSDFSTHRSRHLKCTVRATQRLWRTVGRRRLKTRGCDASPVEVSPTALSMPRKMELVVHYGRDRWEISIPLYLEDFLGCQHHHTDGLELLLLLLPLRRER